MTNRKITKVDDAHVAVFTTVINEEIMKKSSLESRRAALIEEHEKALGDVDELLSHFDKNPKI